MNLFLNFFFFNAIDCPHNYYGEMCLNRCNCNTSIEYCDSKYGCVSNVNKSSKCYHNINDCSVFQIGAQKTNEIKICETFFAAINVHYYTYNNNNILHNINLIF